MLLTTIIDKLDKIGMEGVKNELSENGFTSAQLNKITEVVGYSGTAGEKILFLEKIFTGEKGKKGVEEIRALFSRLEGIATDRIKIEFDLTLARGLTYYTGTIYEVISNDVKMGSILGGGRYDNLTGVFGVPGISGVGISFGLDRTYDVLAELNLFPEAALNRTQVLFIPMDAESESRCLLYADALRRESIRCEIYPDLSVKIGKKFKYADDKKIPYTAVIGSNEMAENKIMVKDLRTAEQNLLSMDVLISLLKDDDPAMPFVDISE